MEFSPILHKTSKSWANVLVAICPVPVREFSITILTFWCSLMHSLYILLIFLHSWSTFCLRLHSRSLMALIVNVLILLYRSDTAVMSRILLSTKLPEALCENQLLRPHVMQTHRADSAWWHALLHQYSVGWLLQWPVCVVNVCEFRSRSAGFRLSQRELSVERLLTNLWYGRVNKGHEWQRTVPVAAATTTLPYSTL